MSDAIQTITDACAAGVSKSTEARALNDRPLISQKASERIRQLLKPTILQRNKAPAV